MIDSKQKLTQLGLFVLRSNGIKQNLIDTIINRIQEEGLKIKLIIPLSWSTEEAEVHLKHLYGEKKFEQYKENILDLSGKQVVAIIVTDDFPIPAPPEHKPGRFSNWRLNIVKDDLRKQYGNILHCSDTEKSAFKEIESLTGLKDNNIQKIRSSVDEMMVLPHQSSSDLLNGLNKIKKMGILVDLWSPPKDTES